MGFNCLKLKTVGERKGAHARFLFELFFYVRNLKHSFQAETFTEKYLVSKDEDCSLTLIKCFFIMSDYNCLFLCWNLSRNVFIK